VIEHQGEKYCNAKEAAGLLCVSRPTFYRNVKKRLVAHQLPGREIPYYKVSEVQLHNQVVVLAS
jgi:hypothetical protein